MIKKPDIVEGIKKKPVETGGFLEKKNRELEKNGKDEASDSGDVKGRQSSSKTTPKKPTKKQKNASRQGSMLRTRLTN